MMFPFEVSLLITLKFGVLMLSYEEQKTLKRDSESSGFSITVITGYMGGLHRK